MREDGELLDAWIAGDQRAARELFDRYFLPLFRFFHGKVSRQAEDLVQDTLLACVKGRDSFRADGSFRAYVFGTARNILKQHYRTKRRKEDRVDFGTVSGADLGIGLSTAFAKKAEHRLLLEGLRQLPLDQQIALELYLWEGLTAAELGTLFEISEDGARSRVRRARDALREAMETISRSPELLESTMSDLEAWAKRLRDEFSPSPSTAV